MTLQDALFAYARDLAMTHTRRHFRFSVRNGANDNIRGDGQIPPVDVAKGCGPVLPLTPHPVFRSDHRPAT